MQHRYTAKRVDLCPIFDMLYMLCMREMIHVDPSSSIMSYTCSFAQYDHPQSLLAYLWRPCLSMLAIHRDIIMCNVITLRWLDVWCESSRDLCLLSLPCSQLTYTLNSHLLVSTHHKSNNSLTTHSWPDIQQFLRMPDQDDFDQDDFSGSDEELAATSSRKQTQSKRGGGKKEGGERLVSESKAWVEVKDNRSSFGDAV